MPALSSMYQQRSTDNDYRTLTGGDRGKGGSYMRVEEKKRNIMILIGVIVAVVFCLMTYFFYYPGLMSNENKKQYDGILVLQEYGAKL